MPVSRDTYVDKSWSFTCFYPISDVLQNSELLLSFAVLQQHLQGTCRVKMQLLKRGIIQVQIYKSSRYRHYVYVE